MKGDVASGPASYQTAVIPRTAASACVRAEGKKINERGGAVCGSVSLPQKCFTHNRGRGKKTSVLDESAQMSNSSMETLTFEQG